MTTLPALIYWRLQHATLVSVLGPPELIAAAENRDGNGVCANRVVLRRWIPYGVTGWRTSPDAPWRPMAELPPECAAALKG